MDASVQSVPAGGEGHHSMMPYHDVTCQSRSTDSKTFSCSFPHYAIMYIDNNGELGVTVSPSVAGCERAIFTQEVRDGFVKSVAGWPSSLQNFHSSAVDPVHGDVTGRQFIMTNASMDLQANPGWYAHGPPKQTELIPCEWQSFQNKRLRRNMRRMGSSDSDSPGPSIKRTALRVGQQELLRRYYEKAFENFQQLNCRIVAKAFVKLVEPRKQVNHPYNGRKAVAGSSQRMDPELTKPKWWPAGVTHKEPDHLLKAERIRLLIHILCELRESHGITAEKLKDAGQDVRRQILPSERLKVLDEIYYVREMEELYLSGKISGDTIIHVSQAHLAEASVAPEDCCAGSDNEQQNSASNQLPLSPVSCCSLSRKSSVESNISSSSTILNSSIMSNEQKIHSTGSSSIPEYYTQQIVAPTSGQHPQAGLWNQVPQANASLAYHGY